MRFVHLSHIVASADLFRCCATPPDGSSRSRGGGGRRCYQGIARRPSASSPFAPTPSSTSSSASYDQAVRLQHRGHYASLKEGAKNRNMARVLWFLCVQKSVSKSTTSNTYTYLHVQPRPNCILLWLSVKRRQGDKFPPSATDLRPRYSSTAAKHNSVRFCDILNRSDSSENEMRKSINADEHFVTNLKIQWIAPNHSRFIFLSNSKRHVPIPP